MHTLQDIERFTGNYAQARAQLVKHIKTLNDKIAGVKATLMIPIRQCIPPVADRHQFLFDAIAESPALFVKPRTRTFDNIKVGLQKQKGAFIIADPERTKELIAKHYPDRLDELAPSERTLSKKALGNMTGAELKKIGVEVEADTDAVIIKPTDSDVDKAVAALLADASEDDNKITRLAA
ncbi:MAG TPA: hypothetical protein VM680_18465 [Verrucomicrobiae bacterium]|nr:hypothetical protein [Verrucomicrobiae bacterium]